MLHLLGLGIFLSLVYKLSPLGWATSSLSRVVSTLDVAVRSNRLDEIEREQQLDLNRARFSWEVRRYGRAQALCHYQIREEEIPAIELPNGALFRPLQAWNIPGDYFFLESERTLLQRWMEETTFGILQGKIGASEIDGQWLLRTGRSRFENPLHAERWLG